LQQEADAVQKGLANAEDVVSGKKTTSGPANVTEAQYNSLKKGDTYWYNGEKVTKE